MLFEMHQYDIKKYVTITWQFLLCVNIWERAAYAKWFRKPTQPQRGNIGLAIVTNLFGNKLKSIVKVMVY